MSTISKDLFEKLKEVLGLPDRTIEFVLSWRKGEYPRVECEYLVALKGGDVTDQGEGGGSHD